MTECVRFNNESYSYSRTGAIKVRVNFGTKLVIYGSSLRIFRTLRSISNEPTHGVGLIFNHKLWLLSQILPTITQTHSDRQSFLNCSV